MSSFSVEICRDRCVIRPTANSVDVYILFTIPDTGDKLADIVSTKAGGRVPKIVRARASIDIEWQNTQGIGDVSWELYLVDKNGEEVKIADGYWLACPTGPCPRRDVKDIDITQHIGGVASMFGVNAMRLRVEKSMFIPVAEISFQIRVYGSIGI